MNLFDQKFTNIFGDSEVAGRSPDAEGDYYHISDAQSDHNYLQAKLYDLVSILSNNPTQEFQILFGGVISDNGNGTIAISEGIVKGYDTLGNKRLIRIPAIASLSLPSGWNNNRQIWVIAKYDFKLGSSTRAHRAGVNYHYQLEDTYLGDTNSENTTSAANMLVDSDPTGNAPILGSFRMNGTTFTNLSLETRTSLFQPARDEKIVGSTIKVESEYIPISASHPWLCLSVPSVTLTTANYPLEFINKYRNRKYIHDEFGTPVSAFSGAWASNVFTLDNNAANVAFITELAEDWLYHGSPTSNWRILRSNNQDYNITGITVATRQITVNIDGSATSGTSVELYTNRVYRDTTKARHFSEAGLATYQAGGGKSGRLFRRDQMQGGQVGATADASGARNLYSVASTRDTNNTGVSDSGFARMLTYINGQGVPHMLKLVNDGTNGTPRTGSKTQAESSSRYEYIYVGSYTA